MQIHAALLEDLQHIRLDCSEAPSAFLASDIVLVPHAHIQSLRVEGLSLVLEVETLDASLSYVVLPRGHGMLPVDPAPWLDSLRPQGPFGCSVEEEYYVFRVFAPRAACVRLHLYLRPEDVEGDRYDMEREAEGVWSIALPKGMTECWYGYSVDGPRGEGEMFNPAIVVGDPYAVGVATLNTFRHTGRALLPDRLPEYDWEGDTHVVIPRRDLMVYEMHVKDMTAHPSSETEQGYEGSYAGMLRSRRGGLAHLRALGVNAVELLPCQNFAWIEPPYGTHAGDDVYNHWNPWERNHWGYMTSYFLAPETRYASTANATVGEWNSAVVQAQTEFKDMVKALHREGVAVILDVVYNHTSQYDYQPLKYLDKRYYYRLDRLGGFTSASGCGNDTHSARFAMRRLIVDSIRHWLQEYHVDGFRLDLGALLDRETLEAIREEARALFPDVLLLAEPWGGDRYDPHGFSQLDYLVWNDLFRNGVKGWDPQRHTGYIFGHWGASPSEAYGTWVLGSVREKAGPLLAAEHSLNYLESHDGYTLADFIRIATGSVAPGEAVADVAAYRTLDARQLAIARFAAFMLFTSAGPLMLHAGQEFGRGKLVADIGVPAVHHGVVDANSYEKDDATNWLDYRYAADNAALLRYYRGLIAMRASLPALRDMRVSNCRFLIPDVPVASGYVLMDESGLPVLAVLANANHDRTAHYQLDDDGPWEVLVDAECAGHAVLRSHVGRMVAVPPCAGMLLRRGA